MIHPTAIINPKASLDSSVNVGPYSIIDADVKIGAGSIIGNHVTITGDTTDTVSSGSSANSLAKWCVGCHAAKKRTKRKITNLIYSYVWVAF